MAAGDSSDKTEKPTPKRLREAREKGQIAKTPDLGSTTGVVGTPMRSAGPAAGASGRCARRIRARQIPTVVTISPRRILTTGSANLPHPCHP